MDTDGMSMLEMFGLTQKQVNILFSLERKMTLQDIDNNPKDSIYKRHWLDRWSVLLRSDIKDEFDDDIREELSASPNNTWFYLVMMEAALFEAYTPLGESKDEDKHYHKLNYKPQIEYLKGIAELYGVMDAAYIDRFRKSYQKTYGHLSGKVQKVALGVVSVVAIAAVTAATAGAFSGPIAVSLFGAQFVGLSGGALTSACLAFAGGGAIAAGGAGMAGGTIAIVGGGALLGAAGGGAAVSTAALLAGSSPSFTLSQAAKLDVVLREIVINAQGDIQNAQKVMEQLKEQIHSLHRQLEESKLEHDADKKAISMMKQSLTYLEKAYRDMARFTTSYQTGVEAG